MKFCHQHLKSVTIIKSPTSLSPFHLLKQCLEISHIQTFYRWPKLVFRFADCKIKKCICVLWGSQTTVLILTCTNCIRIRFYLTLQNRWPIYLYLIEFSKLFLKQVFTNEYRGLGGRIRSSKEVKISDKFGTFKSPDLKPIPCTRNELHCMLMYSRFSPFHTHQSPLPWQIFDGLYLKEIRCLIFLFSRTEHILGIEFYLRY